MVSYAISSASAAPQKALYYIIKLTPSCQLLFSFFFRFCRDLQHLSRSRGIIEVNPGLSGENQSGKLRFFKHFLVIFLKMDKLKSKGKINMRRRRKMNGIEKTVKVLQILIILILSLLIIAYVKSDLNQAAVETLSRFGSTGTEVKQIQTKLKSLGKYTGPIDGVYGTKTKNAVISFQKSVGLTADGIAGSTTLLYLGLGSGGGYGKYSQSDYNLLARVISAEARGEPFTGQVAVGAVVLNRVQSPSFPNTIAGVIYQPGAFSCLDNGQFNQPVASSSYRAAQDALNGWDPTNGAIYYYNPSTAESAWMRKRPIMLRIGNHVFCK
jgi:N-acetylmuramoyl-L-alanine amidase